MLLETDILRAEDRLRHAMLTADVITLEETLSPDLIFTTHSGQVVTKEQDLDAHRSGAIQIDVLELSDYRIQCLGATAVVSVRARIEGAFNGEPASGIFRFTRVWTSLHGGSPQVVAGHASLASEPRWA